MAILRALGAGPRQVVLLLVLESGLLSLAGTLFGVVPRRSAPRFSRDHRRFGDRRQRHPSPTTAWMMDSRCPRSFLKVCRSRAARPRGTSGLWLCLREDFPPRHAQRISYGVRSTLA